MLRRKYAKTATRVPPCAEMTMSDSHLQPIFSYFTLLFRMSIITFKIDPVLTTALLSLYLNGHNTYIAVL